MSEEPSDRFSGVNNDEDNKDDDREKSVSKSVSPKLKYTTLNYDQSQTVTVWTERWFWSTNAKDIGTFYLIFALFSGLLGTAFSVLIRMELSGPGVQYIADNQLYNSIITAHAILMIFFMVKKINIFNYKFESFCVSSSSIKQDNEDKEKTIKINNDNNNNLIIGCSVEDSNNKNNKNFQEPKNKYIKILVNDPFNNRDIILKVTKKQKGVYVWESLDSKHIYVGHSINLYNRISSYFMPSILKTKARRVLRYLNKHGFSNIKLTIYIMNEKSTLEQVVAFPSGTQYPG